MAVESVFGETADTETATGAAARGMDPNIRKILSIFEFIAPICCFKSAISRFSFRGSAGPSGTSRLTKFSRPGNAFDGMPKQTLQYTGFWPFGRNGTWHALPHLLQTASKSSTSLRGPLNRGLDGPPKLGRSKPGRAGPRSWNRPPPLP